MTADESTEVPTVEPQDVEAASEIPQRQRRRRRRRSRDRREEHSRALLIAAVFCSAMGLGGLHWMTLIPAAALAVAAGVFALGVLPGRVLPAPALIPLALCAYTLLQAVPIPLAWLRVLSPPMAEMWSGALTPFGESPVRWATISADPGATLVEGLKWLSYAGVLTAAIVAGARRGPRWAALLLFVAAVAVGTTTFVHGLAGISRVYGIYRPMFRAPRWHIGPLLNPNNLAGYLNLGLLSGMGLLFSRKPALPRTVLAFGITSLGAVVLLSGSRAGVVAMLIGLGLIGVLLRRMQRLQMTAGGAPRMRLAAAFAGIVAGVGLLAWLGATRETTHDLFDKNIEKLEVMRHVAPLVKDHPWFGVGRGAFESVFPAYHFGSVGVVYAHPENFFVQWLAEWGVPVGALALVAFSFMVRQAQRGARRSTAAAGVWAGIVALALQNLLDLAFEVPAVVMAMLVAVGALWGSALGKHVPEEVPPSTPSLAVFRGAAFVSVAALSSLVALFGRSGATRDRAVVYSALKATHFDDASEVETFQSVLRRAVLSHPADPYFPRIGGIVAWQQRKPPFRWIERALERGMTVGATHLQLARVLAASGARSQALLEARLAGTYDPNLDPEVARVIVAAARSFDEILAAVPEGPGADSVLYRTTLLLPRREAAELRVRCLEAAIERNPDTILPRSLLVSDLLSAMSSPNASLCFGETMTACVRTIQAQVVGFAKFHPDTPLALTTLAQLWIATGRARDAEQLLRQGCRKYAYEAYVQCARQRVLAAAATRSNELLNEASTDLAGSGCASGGCGELFAFLGNQAAGLGDLGRALTYYQRSVAEEPTTQRWTVVAALASRLGEHALAASALQHVGRNDPGNPDVLRDFNTETRRSLNMLVK